MVLSRHRGRGGIGLVVVSLLPWSRDGQQQAGTRPGGGPGHLVRPRARTCAGKMEGMSGLPRDVASSGALGSTPKVRILPGSRRAGPSAAPESDGRGGTQGLGWDCLKGRRELRQQDLSWQRSPPGWGPGKTGDRDEVTRAAPRGGRLPWAWDTGKADGVLGTGIEVTRAGPCSNLSVILVESAVTLMYSKREAEPPPLECSSLCRWQRCGTAGDGSGSAAQARGRSSCHSQASAGSFFAAT